MSDRALFAAFQKVKAQVDDAVSLTREREARARAEEEKARAAKKTRVVKAAETRRAEAGTASISASAFSATGGFGAALADAAKSDVYKRQEVVGCILPHGGPRKVAGRTARDGAEGGAVGSAKACADVPFHEGEGGAGKTTRCQSGSSRSQALR